MAGCSFGAIELSKTWAVGRGQNTNQGCPIKIGDGDLWHFGLEQPIQLIECFRRCEGCFTEALRQAIFNGFVSGQVTGVCNGTPTDGKCWQALTMT